MRRLYVYARGMSARDIRSYLEEIYGLEVSPDPRLANATPARHGDLRAKAPRCDRLAMMTIAALRTQRAMIAQPKESLRQRFLYFNERCRGTWTAGDLQVAYMFSKSKSDHAMPQPQPINDPEFHAATAATTTSLAPDASVTKATPSVLSRDLIITGNIESSGDIEVEGLIEGDIRAAHLTVRETATINGEVIAEEVVVSGRVVGRVRGTKVRLSSSAHVSGDIIHKMLAIESGADFEGSVQRHDDPVGQGQEGLVGPHSRQRPRLAAPMENSQEPVREDLEVPQPAE